MSENQARLVAKALDIYYHLLVGHEFGYRHIFDKAWEKNINPEPKSWNERDKQAERVIEDIKRTFFDINKYRHFGLGYSDETDILQDIEKVITYHLMISDGDHGLYIPEPGTNIGSEKLITVEVTETNNI